MADFILAIDQGTTGSTALIFDQELNIRGKANVEFPQHFPKPGWVEHDLNEIWDSVRKAVQQVFLHSKIKPENIVAIGITNQRETTCLWERDEAGTPVSKAIVWQDRRTADYCAKLKKRGLEKKVNRTTGLLLDPYFSGTKLHWLLNEGTTTLARAKKGKLAFGTVESFLVYRMTGEHVTEPSNASRTLLMNLQKCEWDREMLKLFQIPETLLPPILPSCTIYAKTKGFDPLPDGVPIAGLAGDQQAALFGQACFEPGSAKSTYGTGAFVLANVGTKPVYSKHRLLSSVAWKWQGKTNYCLEGSAFIAGAAVQWLRDNLQIITKSAEVEELAKSVPDSGGVLIVPAYTGLGAPHWIPQATGLITGITRGTQRGHIARATLEGVAYSVHELLEAMGKDLGKKIQPLKVDGGASESDLLMQMQSDLLGAKVVRSSIVETTALGSGLQAGLAVGIWKNLEQIKKTWRASTSFTPQMKPAERKRCLERWQKTVSAAKMLA